MPRLRQFVLRLDRPEQLFEADPVSPTSPRYTEYTAQPAMDTIRDLLLMRMPPRDMAVQIDVVLPRDRITPGLDEELTAAVRRWVRVQNTMDVESTEAGGAVGWRLFLIGIVAFFALQMTSIWVRQKATEYDGYLVDSLGEGLSVASWVMLWFPLQIATMEVWRAILRRRRMGVIERVTVRVLPDEPGP
jgi:hypothetical protein